MEKLGKKITKKEINEIMDTHCTHKTGKLDFDEFTRIFGLIEGTTEKQQ